ncbi:hypothetical protein Taro_008192 [Colocasia esculenta]|uniref:Uncharacterized protein n=1 Tax=Colocasia esculenta TaxID=4460 RepID=A0A843U0G8_COLES|nr:hypothetical protein [Colocasia esculenta]
MVRGGRSGRVSTSVGRGSTSPSTPIVPMIGTASPSTPVVPATGTASPTPPIASPFPSQSPPGSHHPTVDEEGPQLLGCQPCWISGGKVDPGSAFYYITTLVHAHIPGPVDSWKEFPPSVRELLFNIFTVRVHEIGGSPSSTSRLGVYCPDKFEKVHVGGPGQGNEDHRQLGSYGLDGLSIWLRRDYWESLCHRWATGPWQERSRAAKRNRATQLEKNYHTNGSVSYATHSQKLGHEFERAPTFRELFDRTHKRKGMDDYVSESARTIVTYDRTMTDCYTEDTPEPDLDPEAWVDVVGVPRKGRVYGFGDNLDTTPVLSSYASSVAPPAYVSSSAVSPDSSGEDMRTLIWEELQRQFGVMVE